MIGTTISHSRILEKLVEGGMGVVYKAHDTKLDRDVALSTTDEELEKINTLMEQYKIKNYSSS